MFIFGGLQFNDPDPFLWVGIYCLVGVVGVLVYFNKMETLFIQLLITGLSIYAATFIPDLVQWIKEGFPPITGKMSNARPSTELMREFFGLIISVVVSIYMLKYNKRSTIK